MLTETHEAWFKAAQHGDDKEMAELLTTEPRLITATMSNKTALHVAASKGHAKAVSLLLAAHPALIDLKNHNGWTALHFAVSEGHEKVAAQLLATSPHLIHAVTTGKSSLLHLAASGGSDKIMTLLLAASPPELLSHLNLSGQTALYCAADKAHETVFAQLLAACPAAIDVRDRQSRTVLHAAVQRGNDHVVTQILTARPELIAAVDQFGLTPLHWAIRTGQEGIAERLLEIKPELIHGVSRTGNTPLHYAITPRARKRFVTKLWQLNLQALHVANTSRQTPLDLAVILRKKELIALFRGSVTFDTLSSTFTNRIHKLKHRKRAEQACKSVLKRQCDPLWTQHLNRDVAVVVLEYLGLDPVKRRPARKRAKLDKEEGERPPCSYQLRSRKAARTKD